MPAHSGIGLGTSVVMFKKSVSRKKNLYRHSTSFYRKVKNKILNSKITFNEIKNHCAHSNQNFSDVTDCNLISNNQSNSTFENEYCDDNCSNSSFLNNIEFDEEIEESLCQNDNENIDTVEKDINLQECLRQWAIKDKISHSSIDNLLQVLISNGFNLPKDSRTLLRTPKFVNVVPMGNGSYWYYGISNNLKTIFQNTDHFPQSISLIFNIDGLSPFNSSNAEIWPILFKIDEVKKLRPKVVAIYYGVGKPPLKPYLKCFTEELNKMLSDGITVKGHKINISIKYFVCDTPARSFIKGKM